MFHSSPIRRFGVFTRTLRQTFSHHRPTQAVTNIAANAAIARRSAAAGSTEEIFCRYAEMENANSRRISSLYSQRMIEDHWIATEKVHGANFGIYSIVDTNHSNNNNNNDNTNNTNSNTATSSGVGRVLFAKRSGIMSPTEHFFGYHLLIPDLKGYIQCCRQLLEAQLQTVSHTVLMNGELFGGKYDHPQVPKKRTMVMVGGKARQVTPVQTDAFPQYSPDLHFYAFDIKYKLAAEDSEYRTLTFDEATRLFEQIPKLLYAKPIVRGPLSKIVAFDVETFQTTIPAQVGMGNFPLRENWAEGLVVRHVRRGDPQFDSGDRFGTLFKMKSTFFQEISNDRSQGLRQDPLEDARRAAVRAVGVQLPSLESVLTQPSQLEAARHLLDHVCLNRLHNVLSKLGTEPFLDESMTAEQLADMLARDALRDFLKEADVSVVNAPVAVRREMTRYAAFEALRLVCSEWANIVASRRDQV